MIPLGTHVCGGVLVFYTVAMHESELGFHDSIDKAARCTNPEKAALRRLVHGDVTGLAGEVEASTCAYLALPGSAISDDGVALLSSF